MVRERQQAIKLNLPQEIGDRAEKMCRRRGWTLDELGSVGKVTATPGCRQS
jgi:hypothetical protein